MSALTKPFIHTTNAVNDVIPVNAENLIEFQKQDINGEFNILFILGDYPREIVWKYAADDTARDADFAAVLAAVSVAM